MQVTHFAACVQVHPDRIRNFSIVAHVDHGEAEVCVLCSILCLYSCSIPFCAAGKSTLADQLLIRTGTVETRDMQACALLQLLADTLSPETKRPRTCYRPNFWTHWTWRESEASPSSSIRCLCLFTRPQLGCAHVTSADEVACRLA